MSRTSVTTNPATANRASGTGQPVAVAVRAPLDATTMSKAGVRLEDALWYARIPAGRHKLRALQTSRGARILDRVRDYTQALTARDAMPMTA